MPIRLSHHPIHPDVVDGIFLCEHGIAFVVGRSEECHYPHRRLNMRKFVDTAGMRRVRSRVTFADRMGRAMLDGAVEAMEEARDWHFQLEAIYTGAMDFTAKEQFTKDFCQKLLDLQSE